MRRRPSSRKGRSPPPPLFHQKLQALREPSIAVSLAARITVRNVMRILYSHRTRSADGQYVHIRALTEALTARGHEIAFAGPDGDEAGKVLDAAGGAGGIKTLLPKALYECAEYGYSYPAFARLRAKARELQPNVLYERYNLFYHAGVWAKRRLELPLILEINAPLAEERARHGGLALKGMAQRSEQAIWRAADMTLPVTNALADYVRAAGVPDERITVIQNGVDAEFLVDRDPRIIRERYNLTGKLVLGFTGFVRDWHRLDRVVRFIADAGRSDLHLLLVGDGPVRPALEQLAREWGVADQVTIAGVVQREAVPDYVAAFDIALQPAATDYASPLKIFEYMALAKPILAPAQANIAEVLAGGSEAVLFDAADDEAFAAGLQRLVDDKELRIRLGAAAKARLIREDFTWAGNAARVEAIAEQLIGNPS